MSILALHWDAHLPSRGELTTYPHKLNLQKIISRPGSATVPTALPGYAYGYDRFLWYFYFYQSIVSHLMQFMHFQKNAHCVTAATNCKVPRQTDNVFSTWACHAGAGRRFWDDFSSPCL